MKINDSGRINPLQSYLKNNLTPKTGNVRAKGTGRDEVSISPEGLEMAQGGMQQADGKQQVQHGEKLERIKQLVQNGTYEVNARLVADKIARYLLGE